MCEQWQKCFPTIAVIMVQSLPVAGLFYFSISRTLTFVLKKRAHKIILRIDWELHVMKQQGRKVTTPSHHNLAYKGEGWIVHMLLRISAMYLSLFNHRYQSSTDLSCDLKHLFESLLVLTIFFRCIMCDPAAYCREAS